jgi:hypothetical protein
MEIINWLITLPGGLILIVFGFFKLYGVKNRLVTGKNKTLRENLCGT